MEAFKTRLMQEYVELNERTEKLEEFILKNPKFESLETEIRTSMLAQKEAMKQYPSSTVATNYVPDWNDMFAKDWIVL